MANAYYLCHLLKRYASKGFGRTYYVLISTLCIAEHKI